MIDRQADLSTLGGLLMYIPRAFAVALLAPFPSQWTYVDGTTGGMRLFAGLEMLLVYVLVIPACCYGAPQLIRTRRLEGIFLVTFIVGTALFLGLVVANVGTLFRLRLMFLMPLLLIAAQADWRQLCGVRRVSA